MDKFRMLDSLAQGQQLVNDFKTAEIFGGIKSVSKANIDEALRCAEQLKRAREPILIHNSFDEIPQRFVNCLTPDSYVRPHMHVVPNQWELMCWLSGEIIALIFDDNGVVIRKINMNINETRIIEIPPFCYHTFIVVKSGSYLEIRNCKYQPNVDRVYSSWSPEENSILAVEYQKQFFTVNVGDKLVI